jgi:hypothetical protein
MKQFTIALFSIFTIVGITAAQPISTQSPFADLIKQTGDKSEYEGQDVVVVFDSSWVDVEESGLSHKRVRTLTKVLTPAGIAQNRAVRFDYDPSSNKIELTKGRIHHKNGKVEDLDLSSALDLPQPQHMIYWGARMKILPIPPLEVGDALEVESISMGFMIAYLASDGEMDKYIPPMRGTYYDVIMFGSDIYGKATPPKKLQSYTITMPDTMPAQYATYNDEVMASMTFSERKLIYNFWKENVASYSEEPRAPDSHDIVPKVVFTSVKSWKDKSKWFFKVNEDRDIFGANDDIRRAVKEITKDCKTDSSKIYEILHWSAQAIRYSGISMGQGEGFTIHPGIMSYNDRCGVCKDIAGMCVTMLRAAGFTTYPVMTMAGSRVETIPADQFNHCVVAVKKPDGSFLMVDPTWSPFNMELWSRAETEQHFVIGSPEGEELMQIQKFTAEENDFSVTLNTSLDAAGTLNGTMRIEGKSYGDARVRRPFSDAGQDQWDEICRGWLTKADPGAQLVKVTYGDLWNFYKPFVFTVEFRVPEYAQVLPDRINYVPFSAKVLWAGGAQFNVLNNLTSDKRTQPVFTYNPRHVTLKETLKLPPEFESGKLPEARDIGDEVAFLKGGWKKAGGSLVLSQIWKVRDRWTPAKEYAKIKKTTDALKKADALTVVLSRKGGK